MYLYLYLYLYLREGKRGAWEETASTGSGIIKMYYMCVNCLRINKKLLDTFFSRSPQPKLVVEMQPWWLYT